MTKQSIVSFLIVAVLAAIGLTACGNTTPTAVVNTVSVPTLTAEQQYILAKSGIEKTAKEVARSSKFKEASACNSTPVELANLKAFRDLPETGASIYKSACKSEIIAMKSEMKAFAKAEADRKKLAAAAKAKQAKKAAAKKVDKKHS